MNETANLENRRQHERFPLMLAAEVSVKGNASPCVIFDISGGGAKVQLKNADAPPAIAEAEAIVLDVPFFGDFRGWVAWTDDEFLGIRFGEDNEDDVKRMVEQAGRDAA